MKTPTAIAEFIALSRELIRRIEETQTTTLLAAAELIAGSLARDGVLFTIGTGHSYFLAAEPFLRAGGLFPVQQVVSGTLSMVDGSARSSRVERLPGFAECVMAEYDMRPGDVLLVISNSGRNAVPIEAALYARERRMGVIALTNVAHSLAEPSRHPSGKRLLDVADIALDNCGVSGDAALKLPGLEPLLAPTSTIAGALLINCLMAQVAANLVERGQAPRIRVSANVDHLSGPRVSSEPPSRPTKHI